MALKILVVSDTHGYQKNLLHVLKKVKPIDLLVHCGDLEGDVASIEREAGCEVIIVAGNNDYGYPYEKVLTFQAGTHKVVVTHGHKYSIYAGLDALYYLARENEADIVMFGHIHRPVLKREDGVTFLNPGSLSLPRQENRRPSYAIMEVDDKNETHYTIRYL